MKLIMKENNDNQEYNKMSIKNLNLLNKHSDEVLMHLQIKLLEYIDINKTKPTKRTNVNDVMRQAALLHYHNVLDEKEIREFIDFFIINA